ncbi:MAG: GTPase ObgE [Chloroflexi bacterium]|nr:GTPase ObgE [Chloroflexota bacterium]
MMFDKVEIRVKSGEGGDGAVSFRREAHVPYGGPDGGDGGNGGAVVIEADPSMTSLRMFKKDKLYSAERGGNGRAKKQHGKNGQDLVIKVPVGTIALDKSKPKEDALLADCQEPGKPVVLVRGGRGGWGNTHYVSSTNQAPRIAQKGESGVELDLILELRLIADVGIIGFPNAGKSTLLSAVSAAKPKIADYPFTTLEPVLGVVEKDSKRFVIAEIPGLIEGAHLGKGLGHDFLRHAVRTKMLIHLVDGSSASPVEDVFKVNTELYLYDAALAQKPQLVAVNKIDLPQVQAKLAEIRAAFRSAGTPVMFISAAEGNGLKELIAETDRVLDRLAAEVKAREMPKAVFRPQPRGAGARVRKEGDVFVVNSPELERIVARVDVSDPEVRRQLQKQMGRLRLSRALQAAGVKPGDKIRCGNYEWEW